jgi:hypothetical protein
MLALVGQLLCTLPYGCLKALRQYSVLWDLNPGLHFMQTFFIFNLSKAHNIKECIDYNNFSFISLGAFNPRNIL